LLLATQVWWHLPRFCVGLKEIDIGYFPPQLFTIQYKALPKTSCPQPIFYTFFHTRENKNFEEKRLHFS
jgi:hypothetical protein